jgi:signal transduction histidine kinase
LNGRLTVSIEDDGPGFPGGDPFSSKTGIGLANTKARLEHLYGADHELRATNGATGGAIVVLELPVEE